MNTKTSLGCVIVAIIIIPLFLYFKEQRERDQLLGKQNAWADHINDSTQAAFGYLYDSTIVFVGTSITANWNLNAYFQNMLLTNRGIPLNTITHIRKRIPAICRSWPQAIVLEGGINDIYNGKDKGLILAEIKDITDSILIISPETQIFLTSILPVSSKGDSAKYNPIIRQVNQMVSSLVAYLRDAAVKYPQPGANQLNLHYVDYTKGISDFMYTDDVHINSQGYLTLKHILKPFLDETQSKNFINAH
jgi:lysophospholipase L1-like esterase